MANRGAGYRPTVKVILSTTVSRLAQLVVAGPRRSRIISVSKKISHFDGERIPERVVHARGFSSHTVQRLQNPGNNGGQIEPDALGPRIGSVENRWVSAEQVLAGMMD